MQTSVPDYTKMQSGTGFESKHNSFCYFGHNVKKSHHDKVLETLSNIEDSKINRSKLEVFRESLLKRDRLIPLFEKKSDLQQILNKKKCL